MSNYDNGIVIGFIGGKDYMSQDNGDGTHSLICPVGKVPEIKRNHDRLVEENAELREILKKLIGNGIGLLNVDDVEDEEDAASIHAKFNDVVNEAGALLAKHKA